MKLLIITRSCWGNNNVGNTMSNIFSGLVELDIHNLYFREENPDNNISKTHYHITEGKLIESLLSGNKHSGDYVDCSINANERRLISEQLIYNKSKHINLMLLNFAREIVWYIGRWKTEEFNKYLDDISPDIVFMPVFGCFYPHRVLKYIRKHTGARIVLFHADDNYTLRQYSISPLYWLYRFILRHYVRDSSKIADLSYCISDIQKNEYEQMLNIPCKTLFKCGDFSGEPPVKQSINYPLKLVFTGNIGSGRWESLALIGDALREINQEGLKAKLEIYTLSPLTGRMRKRLDDGMNIFLCGSISAAEVEKVQEDADILVHVESFKKKYYLVARQSFSTKIVDYLQRARCLLAVGSAECASIDYIDTNNSGVVATTPEMISTKLKLLIDNPSLVQEYGRKGYLCGRRNHQQEKIKGMLRDDLFTVAGISQ